MIRIAIEYIGKVFKDAVGPLLTQKRAKPGDCDDGYAETQHRWRTTSVKVASSYAFLATLVISNTATRPLHLFLLWGQKRVKEFKANCKDGA